MPDQNDPLFRKVRDAAYVERGRWTTGYDHSRDENARFFVLRDTCDEYDEVPAYDEIAAFPSEEEAEASCGTEALNAMVRECIRVTLASGPIETTFGWKDIVSAPKDGTLVLAWNQGPGRRVQVAFYGMWHNRLTETDHEGWHNGERALPDLTHWRPLPISPEFEQALSTNPLPSRKNAETADG